MNRKACPCAACFSNSRRGTLLLFESGDYFVLHFRRCGDYLRAVSDRANTVYRNRSHVIDLDTSGE